MNTPDQDQDQDLTIIPAKKERKPRKKSDKTLLKPKKEKRIKAPKNCTLTHGKFTVVFDRL